MTESGVVVLKTGGGEPVLAHAPTDIASMYTMGIRIHQDMDCPKFGGIGLYSHMCSGHSVQMTDGFILHAIQLVMP